MKFSLCMLTSVLCAVEMQIAEVYPELDVIATIIKICRQNTYTDA